MVFFPKGTLGIMGKQIVRSIKLTTFQLQAAKVRRTPLLLSLASRADTRIKQLIASRFVRECDVAARAQGDTARRHRCDKLNDTKMKT